MTRRNVVVMAIKEDCLVKTRRFNYYKYLGDPLNAAQIYSDQEADELMIIGLDTGKDGNPIAFKLLERIAANVRMPVAYTGGVQTIGQINRLISAGIEKVGMNSAFDNNCKMIKEAVNIFGGQSIVACLDLKKDFKVDRGYKAMRQNGKIERQVSLEKTVELYNSLNVGEVFVNFIDSDGVRNGFDLSIIDWMYSKLNCQLTVCGGCAEYNDICKLRERYKYIGIAASSLYCLTANTEAVLIRYECNIKQRIS